MGKIPIGRRSFLKKSSFAGFIGLSTELDFQAPVVTAKNARLVLAADKAVAETKAGRVRGYIDGGIFTFKGIPYADSTAGENRFKPAKPVTPWQDIRDSLSYGPVCPQRPNKGWASEEYAFLFQWNDGYQGEDCLRINIWSTGLASSAKKPVMFWIHGGAFFSGSSQEHPSYDGRNLSELGDVVVVSVNHRLNIFGFLDLSDYGTEFEESGNVGMLDLVVALEWVKDNIQNFGGDPNNVTIFGQSGGAAKVTTLMAMPRAKGLFHKAISQSTSTARVANKAYSQSLASEVLSYLNIKRENVRGLHALDFKTLIEASIEAEKKMPLHQPNAGRPGWQPVADGKIIPSDPWNSEAPVLSEAIPFLIGSNRHEWSASIGDAKLESLTEQDLLQKLTVRFQEKGQDLLNICKRNYPKAKPVEILSFLNPYNSMAHVLAEKKSRQRGSDVFLYMFSWETQLMDGRPRACHCSEIPFVFYNTDRCKTLTGATDEARELASKIAAAWINFARTGNPNHRKLPHWPAFSIEKGEIMMLNNRCEVQHDPDREFRNFYMNM